jgi:H+/gluconate symporter-like permease
MWFGSLRTRRKPVVLLWAAVLLCAALAAPAAAQSSNATSTTTTGILPPPPVDGKQSQVQGLDGAAITGILVAVCCCLVLCCVACLFVSKQKEAREREYKAHEALEQATYAPLSPLSPTETSRTRLFVELSVFVRAGAFQRTELCLTPCFLLCWTGVFGCFLAENVPGKSALTRRLERRSRSNRACRRRTAGTR